MLTLKIKILWWKANIIIRFFGIGLTNKLLFKVQTYYHHMIDIVIDFKFNLITQKKYKKEIFKQLTFGKGVFYIYLS